MKSAQNHQSGFTMLELIVSLAIIGIISGFIINNFADFRKQQIQNAAEEMVSNLRFIQNNALAGIKPCSSTDTLFGWYIRLQPNATSYDLGYICDNGSSTTAWKVKTVQLGSSFKIKGFSWTNTNTPPTWISRCQCNSGPTCASNENYYYIFTTPKGLLYYATIIQPIFPPWTPTDFNSVKGLTSGTTAVGIILEDPNFKSSKNQYKGIGISPVGGMTLKSLNSASDWNCDSDWSSSIF